MMNQRSRTGFSGAVVLIASCALLMEIPAVSTAASSRYRNVTLERDTVLPVSLVKEVNSRSARRGDPVQARVMAGDDNALGLPEGTRVLGVVREVTRHRGDQPGTIDLQFNRLRMPDGWTSSIATTLVSLEGKQVTRRSDGTIVAKPNRSKDRTRFIGYGAGAGVLLGVLTRGGKVRLTDALLGAALGYAASEATRGKEKPGDVTLTAGTEFGLALDRDVVVRASSSVVAEEDDSIDDWSMNGTREVRPAVTRRETTTTTRRTVSTTPRRGAASNTRSSSYTSRSADLPMVRVGDQPVAFGFSQQPYRIGTTWMLPVRPVLEAIGNEFRYDSARKELSVDNTMNPVVAVVGSRVLRHSDGSRSNLSRAPELRNGTLYGPAEFFERATLRRVLFDDVTNTLYFLKAGE